MIATRGLLALTGLMVALPGIATAQQMSRADVGTSISSLSEGLPDWRETTVALSHRFGDGWAGVAKLDMQTRFDSEDAYSELRLERTLTRGAFYLAAGGSRDADFRPRTALKAGGQIDISGKPEAIMLTLDVDASRFASGAVYSIKSGVDLQLGAAGWRATVQAVSVLENGGRSLVGFALQTRAPLGPTVSAQLGYADAPETSEGIVVRVRAWTGGLRFDVSDTWVLRLDVAHEDRGAYLRNELSAGAALRF